MKPSLVLLYLEDSHDDFEFFTMCIQRYITDMTVRITRAETVEGAIHIYGSHAFDGVILDCNLSDGYGVDAAYHIRERSADMPIIFLSGTWTADSLAMTERVAPVGRLFKDYTEAHTKRIINLLMDR